ncbi:MAG: hypothetical protein Kow0092_10880 [Deferrisomatales bacterium]
MAAKFALKTARDGQLLFNLRAADDPVVLTSELYKQKKSAENGIESVRKNAVPGGAFDARTTASGQPCFVLRAARAGDRAQPVLGLGGGQGEGQGVGPEERARGGRRGSHRLSGAAAPRGVPRAAGPEGEAGRSSGGPRHRAGAKGGAGCTGSSDPETVHPGHGRVGAVSEADTRSMETPAAEDAACRMTVWGTDGGARSRGSGIGRRTNRTRPTAKGLQPAMSRTSQKKWGPKAPEGGVADLSARALPDPRGRFRTTVGRIRLAPVAVKSKTSFVGIFSHFSGPGGRRPLPKQREHCLVKLRSPTPCGEKERVIRDMAGRVGFRRQTPVRHELRSQSRARAARPRRESPGTIGSGNPGSAAAET